MEFEARKLNAGLGMLPCVGQGKGVYETHGGSLPGLGGLPLKPAEICYIYTCTGVGMVSGGWL